MKEYDKNVSKTEMDDSSFCLCVQQELHERESNYQQLLQADSSDLVTNTATFTCPICFDDTLPGEGVILRECLHQFCKWVQLKETKTASQQCIQYYSWATSNFYRNWFTSDKFLKSDYLRVCKPANPTLYRNSMSEISDFSVLSQCLVWQRSCKYSYCNV